MNENLDLVEILKDCPKGTMLYSPMFGEVELYWVRIEDDGPIVIEDEYGDLWKFSKDGSYSFYEGDCLLFPSKEQRDWSRFEVKKKRFNPRNLMPFDKVLVRDYLHDEWICTFFSHIRQNCKSPYICDNLDWKYCIPYNDDTKYLVGETDEAPKFYRYWED